MVQVRDLAVSLVDGQTQGRLKNHAGKRMSDNGPEMGTLVQLARAN